MNQRTEGHFLGHQNYELFYQAWLTDSNPSKGTLLITHGLGEHSERYDHVAQAVNRAGWDVYGWDMRGHGKSEGQRGYIEDFRDFERDLDCLAEHLKSKHKIKPKPFILFGHSLGGLVCIRRMIYSGAQPFDGLVLSSPLLGLALEVPSLKKAVGELASKYLPRLTMGNEIALNDLTRDGDMLEATKMDPLFHDKISPRIFTGMTSSFDFVQSKAFQFTMPFFLQVGDADLVTNTKEALRFFENISSEIKICKVYKDNLHEIYNDLDRTRVIEDLVEFLKRVEFEKQKGHT